MDGVQVGTASFTVPISWSLQRDLRIGRPVAPRPPTRFLQGTLDEAALYTAALPAATVLAHYKAGKP